MEYEIVPFTKTRRNIELLLELRKKHIIHTILEADVTDARKKIKEYKRKGVDISFTAWFIKCFVEVIKEEKIFNSIRHGKKKIVIFNDIDVAIPIERKIDGKVRPVAYIIRKANEMDIMDITKEIRKAQKMEVDEKTQVLDKMDFLRKFALNAPIFVQKLLWLILSKNAFRKKKYMGTTAVTAVGMKGNFKGWLITLGGHFTTSSSIGGITRKVLIKDGKLMEREFLRFIISVDHDVIDGAPLARFSDKLINLLEKSYGL